jgi:hypothetical protein
MALFETLNWAVALDERVGTHWLPDGKPLGWKWRQRLGHGAEIMGGVRFARNSVHHQGRMRYSSPAAGCTPNVSLSTVSGGRG